MYKMHNGSIQIDKLMNKSELPIELSLRKCIQVKKLDIKILQRGRSLRLFKRKAKITQLDYPVGFKGK